MQNIKKFQTLRTIWKMKWHFLPMSARKNREEIGMFLFEEGEKLELLAKRFTHVTGVASWYFPPCRFRRFDFISDMTSILFFLWTVKI